MSNNCTVSTSQLSTETPSRRSFIQVPQHTARTRPNNVNQHGSCPGYQRDQSMHRQPWHGDGTIESKTRAAETLTSLGTISVRDSVRSESSVATEQHGAPCFSNGVYSPSTTTQSVENMTATPPQYGSTNLQSQDQNHSSASALSAMDGSDAQRQNDVVSARVPQQPGANDATSQLAVSALGDFKQPANPAQIQASCQPASEQGTKTASRDTVNQHHDRNDDTTEPTPTAGPNGIQYKQSPAIDSATVHHSLIRKAEAVRKPEETEEAKKRAQGVEERKFQDGEEAHKEKPRRMSESRTTCSAGSGSGKAPTQPNANETEAEIRAVMAKVREMGEKHPALLSKVWKEKQNHTEGTTTSNSQRLETRPSKVAEPETVPHLSSAVNPSQLPVPALPPVQQTTPTLAKVSATPSVSSVAEPAKQLSALPSQKPQNNARKMPTNPLFSETKGAVAVAAAQWLNARSENRKTYISPLEILNMLHSNLSYIQLCDMIEKQGFKVDRASLARAVLQNVPKASSTHPESAPSTNSPNQQAQRPNDTHQMMPIPQPKARYNDDGQQLPLLTRHTPAMQTQANGVKNYGNGNEQQHGHAPKPVYEPPAYRSPYGPVDQQTLPSSKPPPATSTLQTTRKAEELAALPQNEKNRSIASEQDIGRKRSFANTVDLTALSHDGLPPPPPSKRLRVGQQLLNRLTPPRSPPFYPHAPSSAPRPSHHPDPHVAMPSDAPSQLPQSTSLSTSQRPTTQTKLKEVELAKPIMRSKAIRRSAYDPRTIARDVLLATGRHPDREPLNAHLGILKTSFRGQITDNSDLSTIRWDLIDPGEPIPFDDDDKDSVLDYADDEEEVPGPPDRTGQVAIANDSSVATVQRRNTLTSQKHSINPKPSIKTSQPHHAAARTQPYASTPSSNRSTTSAPDANDITLPSSAAAPPPSATSTAPTPEPPRPSVQRTSYAEFRAAMAAAGTPLPRKKGRPLGWRKYPNPRESPAPAKPTPDPKYPVFPCGWLGCGARLHNLETLRRHIWKVHGRQSEDGLWRCRWEGCGRDEQSVDPKTGEVGSTRRPLGFETLERLREHVENAHVSPIAWKLGDGPAGGLSDAHDSEMSEAYLSDSKGRRVTPTISVSAEDSQAEPNVPAVTSRGPGRPAPKTAQDKAEESEEAAIRRKKEIGAGVDKGGVRLANAKRRQGFRDDEEFEMVVDGDED